MAGVKHQSVGLQALATAQRTRLGALAGATGALNLGPRYNAPTPMAPLLQKTSAPVSQAVKSAAAPKPFQFIHNTAAISAAVFAALPKFDDPVVMAFRKWYLCLGEAAICDIDVKVAQDQVDRDQAAYDFWTKFAKGGIDFATDAEPPVEYVETSEALFNFINRLNDIQAAFKRFMSHDDALHAEFGAVYNSSDVPVDAYVKDAGKDKQRKIPKFAWGYAFDLEKIAEVLATFDDVYKAIVERHGGLPGLYTMITNVPQDHTAEALDLADRYLRATNLLRDVQKQYFGTPISNFSKGMDRFPVLKQYLDNAKLELDYSQKSLADAKTAATAAAGDLAASIVSLQKTLAQALPSGYTFDQYQADTDAKRQEKAPAILNADIVGQAQAGVTVGQHAAAKAKLFADLAAKVGGEVAAQAVGLTATSSSTGTSLYEQMQDLDTKLKAQYAARDAAISDADMEAAQGQILSLTQQLANLHSQYNRELYAAHVAGEETIRLAEISSSYNTEAKTRLKDALDRAKAAKVELPLQVLSDATNVNSQIDQTNTQNDNTKKTLSDSLGKLIEFKKQIEQFGGEQGDFGDHASDKAKETKDKVTPPEEKPKSNLLLILAAAAAIAAAARR
jgi:hypothetical protein